MDGITIEDIITKDDEEDISYDGINHLISGWIEDEGLKIPRIVSTVTMKDRLGNGGVRLGINRDGHKVPTGLYALGSPGRKSPLLATCNYKLTFDILRRDLEGMDVWILVLDTKGINVWCASGKGTFSSRELMYQMNKWKVKDITGSNKVIVPQLGATSMEPHLVRRLMDIRIIYGPVRSCDLVKFMEDGFQASEDMRRVTYGLRDRLVLAPVEVVHNLPFWILSILLCLLMSLSAHEGLTMTRVLMMSLPAMIGILGSTFLFQALLPLLPGRYFSVKGLIIGLVPAALLLLEPAMFHMTGGNAFIFGYAILILNMSSWIAFKFTGSTTFTSMSGVEIESNRIMPVLRIASYTGFALIFTGMVTASGF